ncbi:hypothetical protein [Curtobacterium sp. MCSS17_016]|uniref:hypothetical protein n=1 Tax=Curtobacterium sp. MCSS17_016 TaxID=2175644 RepID=UPI000DA71378|nr:hypothetical protein [Curtobacterium sp. MCSS17_016]WIE81233.1 hypothetical protein DEJ19_018540 [Curtobacterium sp. MCSS17_016]
MASITFSETKHPKRPASVAASPLPAGGHLIQVKWGTTLHLSLDPDEAAQLRDDLTAALEQTGH